MAKLSKEDKENGVKEFVAVKFNIEFVEKLPLFDSDTRQDFLENLNKNVIPDISVDIGGTIADRSLNNNDGESFSVKADLIQ